jgi:hypothetical protein
VIVSYVEWDIFYEMEDEAGCRGEREAGTVPVAIS